jgi:hypothetical protein
MALTDTAIRGAKPQPGRTLKLSDGGGLQLWVMPTGSKLWKIAYRSGGKQLKLSLGIYPAVGLKDAREQRDAAKRNACMLTLNACPSNLNTSPQRERTGPSERRR